MNIKNLTTKSEDAAAFLALLANAQRLRILCELHQAERTVGDLEQVVDLSQSALSQHLAKLRAGGAVKTRRDAQTIHYSIADERLSRLLAVMYDMFCRPELSKAASSKSKLRRKK